MELTDNIYHRNINNNSGIFDYLIGAAEEQECKEAFLAYHFLRIAPAPPTADELARRAAEWLRKAFGVDVTFNVGEATKRLERLGLLATRGGRLFVSPLDAARRAWPRMGWFLPAHAADHTAISQQPDGRLHPAARPLSALDSQVKIAHRQKNIPSREE